MIQMSRPAHALPVALAALVAIALACAGASDDAAPEAVREAAARHVQASAGRMRFDDPAGDGRLALVFDHVHEGVGTTEGGRQVVCVDFTSADGTVYDVDFYVDRPQDTGELVVEDAVIHKVGDRNVLPDGRRAELDRKS